MDYKVTVECLQRTEVACLKYLNYNLDVPNSLYLLNILLTNGIIFTKDFFNDDKFLSNEAAKNSNDSTRSRSQFNHRRSLSYNETNYPILNQIVNDPLLVTKKTEQLYSLCIEIHTVVFEGILLFFIFTSLNLKRFGIL